MVKKLLRDYCLIKYRSLPLQHFDKETNSDILYSPNHEGVYWIKSPESKENNSEKLIQELINLISSLNINDLIFLNEINLPWISKYTAQRKDSKQLTTALNYFKSKNIWTDFNGGVLVCKIELKDFLLNFYTITKHDSGFFFYNFTDEKQKIIFYLHYSGDIQVITLTEEMNISFLKQIKNTSFIDCGRQDSNKI
ncbi:MAG: hypothetical protein WCY89_04720 [Flavobacteriaceae bacterium]